MKSAYLLLGVPGNATADDIAAAFAKAKAHYTPAHMADTPGALERFNEVKTAYEILRNPDTRAAHDRKLLAAQELAVRQQEEAERERSRVAAQDAARARQMEYDSRASLSRSHSDQSRAMALEAAVRREQASQAQREQREQRDQQQAIARANSEREQRERRLAFEAQRRLATDKQRIRELCIQEYRRPDC